MPRWVMAIALLAVAGLMAGAWMGYGLVGWELLQQGFTGC